MDALLKKIRDLEEQAGTQRQVIDAVKAGVPWMDVKAEETLCLADDFKDQVVRYTTTATPESKLRQIHECKCCMYLTYLAEGWDFYSDMSQSSHSPNRSFNGSPT